MEKQQRIYISVPMQGREISEIIAEERDLCAKLDKYVQNAVYVLPTDLKVICEGIWDKPKYGHFLGFDISVILEDCTAVAVGKNWRESKGCRAELAISEIYDKKIIYL
ncbi:MAG: DUF4406 domain-containing protein [Prevotellaceae bacterium]|jgi:hypothetical protein|nr:DUF4406 domain-containing protein [Prevotellaceae bacterium]